MLAKNYKKSYIKKNEGFVALMSVLIVGAVGVIILTSLVSLGVSSVKSSISIESGNRALIIADSCAEEVLLKIREDNSFIGTEQISFEGGSCIYEVEGGGGEERTIKIEGRFENSTKRLLIIVSEINPKIIINQWSEVDTY